MHSQNQNFYLKSTTGAGFTFSNPFNYDGMTYFGNQTFVSCAEEETRFNECSSLLICVERDTTHYDYLKTAFPPEFFTVVSSLDEISVMLFNNTCNVGVYDKTAILTAKLSNDLGNKNFILSQKSMTKEPLAIVSRNDDREFSDIVNWVLQALFFGEEQGLTRDPALCQAYTNFNLHDASRLHFLNAVYCVGNYGEIFHNGLVHRGRNNMNNGTGMLYAIPFGELKKYDIMDPVGGGTMAKIKQNRSLSCGVIVPPGFVGNVRKSDKLVGMSVDYCRTLAAALFVGNSEALTLSTFQEPNTTAFAALASRDIDVLVGGQVKRKYDFKSSASLDGFHFSIPYYYGDEIVR